MHGIPFSADNLYKSTERSSEEGKRKDPNMVQCGMVSIVQCTVHGSNHCRCSVRKWLS